MYLVRCLQSTTSLYCMDLKEKLLAHHPVVERAQHFVHDQKFQKIEASNLFAQPNCNFEETDHYYMPQFCLLQTIIQITTGTFALIESRLILIMNEELHRSTASPTLIELLRCYLMCFGHFYGHGFKTRTV
jgi:hypothetical protein